MKTAAHLKLLSCSLCIVASACLGPVVNAQEIDSNGDATVLTNRANSKVDIFIKKQGTECATGITKSCSADLAPNFYPVLSSL
jgi:hypothetical protein